MDLRRWTHRQVVFLAWLVAVGAAYSLGGLAYSIPLGCVFVIYEVLLMRWVARSRTARR